MVDEGSSSPSIQESKIHFFQVESQQSCSFFLWPLCLFSGGNDELKSSTHIFQTFMLCFFEWRPVLLPKTGLLELEVSMFSFFAPNSRGFHDLNRSCVEFVSEVSSP